MNTMERYYDPDRTDRRKREPGIRSKTWKVAEMQSNHHEIARLKVMTTWSNKRIAEELGVSPQMISNVLNSPVVQEKVRQFEMAKDGEALEVQERIENLAPQALDILEGIMLGGEGVSKNLQAKEANTMLDRAGYGAIKKTEERRVTAFLTGEDIIAIKKRALEMGILEQIISE